MGLERRTFLQQAGLALLTVGVPTKTPWLKRYVETLAQPTNRKLALLVGINEYAFGTKLNGCVTDVELQRELLIDRFGFQSSDILILTEKKATRKDIETAFVHHLSDQAKPDDVVVFHFSGYGTQVKLPVAVNPAQPEYRLVNALLPVDGRGGNDLLEETLMLLGRSLATEKVTMVLDTSYQDTGKVLLGNLRVRSLATTSAEPSPEELVLAAQLGGKLGGKIAPSGMILSAASTGKIATEAAWNGFYAGLFTYALTQYLWEATPSSTVVVSWRRTAEKVEPVMGKQQQPRLTVGENVPNLIYYLLPEKSMGAEGTVVAVEENNTVVLKLVGLPPGVLLNYGINSCFTLVSPAAEPLLLQIRSREGLRAKAKPLGKVNELQVGQVVQEYIRILHRNLGLIIALDAELARIERVDATSAFSSIPVVASVVTAGEQAADCLFARVKDHEEALTGYGLFSVGGVLIANTKGSATEAVKLGVRRLVPQLNTLLAAKLWRLTVNEGSSRLRVTASLELIEPKNISVIQRETKRAGGTLPGSGNLEADKATNVIHNLDEPLPTIKSGSKIQYGLANNSDRPIYVMLLGVNSEGTAIAFYSPSLNQPILRGDTQIIPQPDSSFNWIVDGPVGLTEILLICADAPFTKTTDLLSAYSGPLKTEQEQLLELSLPLELSQALLEDLHATAAVGSEITGSLSDIYALDVNTWATLSFVYQVV
ncbi:MAG: caspase family protein [Gomphosphaeria aponina SAG 52.96 = DSM 107014]|uniref:Caspase family protein n=1 Tax=Gomphosphaeria aponina SAG 52.96 = DSM 107014 TaxID=1521640 RepID=A0A941GXS1_9CHRO|nr:caspase family protein [Gomphosphaeria aponina SAG 52.96 = DSM 107014]